MQHAWSSERERRSVIARCSATATSFDADQTHTWISDEGMKDSRSIRATTNTRDNRIRQTREFLEALRAAFAANHALKVAHHHWKRMRSDNAADDVMGFAN